MKATKPIPYSQSTSEDDLGAALLLRDALAVDEIDTELAPHYGFTEEELDFIINYDIKYRMGREEENEDE